MSLRVALLGGGIMGATLALCLARGGARVAPFERQGSVLNGASRWNEDKLHLGYLCAGDLSRRLVARMQAGGWPLIGGSRI